MFIFKLRLRFTEISLFCFLIFFLLISQAAVEVPPQITAENDANADIIEVFCSESDGLSFRMPPYYTVTEREALYETNMCKTSRIPEHGHPPVTTFSPCTSDTAIGSSFEATSKVYAYINDTNYVLVGSNGNIPIYGNDDDSISLNIGFNVESRCYGSYRTFREMLVFRYSVIDDKLDRSVIIGKSGENVKLNIYYNGLVWLWYDSYGMEIADDAKYTVGLRDLVINDASVNDCDVFTAKTANSLIRPQAFYVSIESLPYIRISTESVDVQADQAFNFSCTVISVGIVFYGSYFQKCHLTDDKELYCAETVERSYFDQVLRPLKKKYHYTYDILYKPVGAAGRVVCFAINKMGQANVSAAIYVNVTTANDLITMSGIDPYGKIYEKQQVSIRCDASAGIYKEFRWFSNGTRVYASKGLSVNHWISDNFLSTMIRFDQFRILDGGQYECRAFPKNGARYKRRYWDVYVNVNLTLHGFDPERTIYEGEEVTIICAGSKQHFVKLEWFCNQTKVLDSKGISVKNSKNSSILQTTLHFDKIRIHDRCTYECRALPFTDKTCVVPVDLHVHEKFNWLYSVVIIAAVLSAISVVCLCGLMWRERRSSNEMRDYMLAAFAEEFENYVAPDSTCEEPGKQALQLGTFLEFPPERLTFGKHIGSGEFGVVMRAEALGIKKHECRSLVAVKRANQQLVGNRRICRLVSELRVLIHLGPHLNVVSLLGAVTKDIAKGELMIVVEYCPYGNVRKVLQDNRDEFVDLIDGNTGEIGVSRTLSSYKIRRIDETHYAIILSTRDLLSWAYQVARGMSFLNSKRVIHNNLAARNVLLSDHKVVKICDFRLSRRLFKANVYQKGGKEPMPGKWMAPESVRDRIFSVKSDVWSYGILLWEFFSLGREPFGGDQFHPDLVARIRNGYRLDKPDYANRYLHDIMRSCWSNQPNDRPSFDSLTEIFASLMGDDVSHYYLKFDDISHDENGPQTTTDTVELAGESINNTVEFAREIAISDPDLIEEYSSNSSNEFQMKVLESTV